MTISKERLDELKKSAEAQGTSPVCIPGEELAKLLDSYPVVADGANGVAHHEEEKDEGEPVAAILKCPKKDCPGYAIGTLEEITGCALIMETDEGKFQFTGTTDVYWDGQMTKTGESGRPELICGECFEEFEAPEGFELA